MGRAVSAVLDAREDVVVSARFDRGESPDLSLCDVIIDFSTPEASVELAQACAARGGPALVIGSTGLTEAQDAEVLKAAEKIAIVRSGNFSLGVNILIGLVEHAAQRLDARDWDIEISEAHHRRKVDAPSGTALMLGDAVANGRAEDLEDIRAAPWDGITGPRQTGKVGFSSTRAGGIIGEHTVLFASDDEVLTLSHSAIDRSLFAKGAVAAAAWVRSRKPGLYDMQDVLGFRQA
jgi:4-hydroxy-tetrahydrodipicolinate reductase